MNVQDEVVLEEVMLGRSREDPRERDTRNREVQMGRQERTEKADKSTQVVNRLCWGPSLQK